MLEVIGNHDRIIGRLEGSMNALTKQIEGLTFTMKTFEEKNFNATSRLDEYEQRLDTYAISFNDRLVKIEKKEAAHDKKVSDWRDKLTITAVVGLISLAPFGDKVSSFFSKVASFLFGFH